MAFSASAEQRLLVPDIEEAIGCVDVERTEVCSTQGNRSACR